MLKTNLKEYGVELDKFKLEEREYGIKLDTFGKNLDKK